MLVQNNNGPPRAAASWFEVVIESLSSEYHEVSAAALIAGRDPHAAHGTFASTAADGAMNRWPRGNSADCQNVDRPRGDQTARQCLCSWRGQRLGVTTAL